MRDARRKAFAVADLAEYRGKIARRGILGGLEEVTLAVEISGSLACHPCRSLAVAAEIRATRDLYRAAVGFAPSHLRKLVARNAKMSSIYK
ncbi:MAG: hypothetical protein RIB52_11550 [Erythrobacter sp.]|uniref:hypothetical protein n=1 Tax=Erythrobacter sp. TaxID=1042 RepID=UPI0032EAF1EB